MSSATPVCRAGKASNGCATSGSGSRSAPTTSPNSLTCRSRHLLTHITGVLGSDGARGSADTSIPAGAALHRGVAGSHPHRRRASRPPGPTTRHEFAALLRAAQYGAHGDFIGSGSSAASPQHSISGPASHSCRHHGHKMSVLPSSLSSSSSGLPLPMLCFFLLPPWLKSMCASASVGLTRPPICCHPVLTVAHSLRSHTARPCHLVSHRHWRNHHLGGRGWWQARP